ncbi:uncharacterized protein F5891DRAFT_1204354, partial [Suillus fuscotomentosus]
MPSVPHSSSSPRPLHIYQHLEKQKIHKRHYWMKSKKTLLCRCRRLGCGMVITQPFDERSDPVRGVWLPPATFYRHKRFDRACMDIEDEANPCESSLVREQSVGAGVTSPSAAPTSIDYPDAVNVPRFLRDIPDEASAAGRLIPDVSPSSLLADTDNVARAVQDLQHVIKFINQSAASLSYTNLIFDRPHKGNFVPTAHPDAPNIGPCKLQVEAKENASILRHERKMFQALIAVQSIDRPISLESTAAAVLQRAADELQRIDDIKAGEWERQRCSSVSIQPEDAVRGSKVPVIINTDIYFRQYESHPATLACYFLILTLSLLCGLSREKCNFALATLRFIMRCLVVETNISPSSEEARLADLPRDSRTLLKRIHLDPKCKSYITCPSCFKLYNDDDFACPEYCIHSPLPGAPQCSTKLKRTRIIRGTAFERPVKKYLYQDMKQWLARFLSRSDIESKLERGSAANMKVADGEQHDIWDAEVLQNFQGPDGSPFVCGPPKELRLVFSLGVDGFNPSGMKIGKGSASSTGIYMVCLNLPVDLRYHPENMYLVG